MHVLQRSLHRGGMGIDAVGHHGSIGGGQGTGARASTWCGGRGAIGGGRVSVGRGDAVGRGLGLGLGIGVATQTGTLEEMLLLAGSVLRTNLLAVDALDGETLQEGRGKRGVRDIGVEPRDEILREIR